VLIELVVAPALVAGATLAARRWGPHAGGVVSAFPAIVGPVLLITAVDHGSAFTARAANGTLLGLVALAAFAYAYGSVAPRRRWQWSLSAGWLAAALTALAAQLGGGAGPPAGLLLALASLCLAELGLRSGCSPVPAPVARVAPRCDLPIRMALTALLVFSLAGAATALGPRVGGMLAALPVLASLLAVFTHRQQGGLAAAALLRGTLAGMGGFVAFVEVVGVLIVPAGIAVAFAGATVAAVIVPAIAVGLPVRGRPATPPLGLRVRWTRPPSPPGSPARAPADR
jgi:hypothetical protein